MHPSMNDAKKFMERKGVQLFLKSIGGESAPLLAKNMITPISDEDLAKKCKMKPADVRMVLNKMHNAGVIDYNRSKDKDTGWYYYGWFVRVDKLLDEYLKKKERDLKDIHSQLEDNQALSVYICRKCEQTYDFDRAASLLYHCPFCEAIMDKANSEENIKKIERISLEIIREISEVKEKFGHLGNVKYKTMKVL